MCNSRFDTNHVPQADSTTKTHYISKTMTIRLILALFKITVLYNEKETKPSDAHDFMAENNRQQPYVICILTGGLHLSGRA